MKKVVLSLVAAVVLAMSLLVGCGGGNAPDTLEGTTWTITKAEAQGVDAVALAKAAGMSSEMTCKFQDGKAVLNMMGSTTSGDYSYSDGKLTLEGETTTVNGNTIEFDVEGVHLVMEKK